VEAPLEKRAENNWRFFERFRISYFSMDKGAAFLFGHNNSNREIKHERASDAGKDFFHRAAKIEKTARCPPAFCHNGPINFDVSSPRS